MTTSTPEAARRAIEDPAFAQAVLDGKEDFPEVRAALVADLQAMAEEAEVQGFLNPCPLPPGYASHLEDGRVSTPDEPLSFELNSFSWGSVQLPSLQGLATA